MKYRRRLGDIQASDILSEIFTGLFDNREVLTDLSFEPQGLAMSPTPHYYNPRSRSSRHVLQTGAQNAQRRVRVWRARLAAGQ